MEPPGDDSSALMWGLRRYALPLMALILSVAVAAVAGAQWLRSNAGYTASALVIATELQVRQEQLPRLGESVFNSGSVARDVAGTLPTADHRTLVPDRISLDPIPETIAFHVRGHSDDPAEAARLANVAAGAFVDALNSAGAGVGVFRLQDPAFVPLERDVSPIVGTVAGMLGLAVGGLLAASVLSLLIAVRGPVLTPTAAVAATGLPLLAVVTLPRRRRGRAGTLGIRNLLTALPELPASLVELAGPRGSERARREVLELLRRSPAPRPVPGAGARRVIVTDVAGVEEIALRLPGAPVGPDHDEPVASVVMVVPEGASAASVRDVVRGFLPEELAGAVFLRRRSTAGPAAAAEVSTKDDPAPVPQRTADPAEIA